LSPAAGCKEAARGDPFANACAQLRRNRIEHTHLSQSSGDLRLPPLIREDQSPRSVGVESGFEATRAVATRRLRNGNSRRSISNSILSILFNNHQLKTIPPVDMTNPNRRQAKPCSIVRFVDVEENSPASRQSRGKCPRDERREATRVNTRAVDAPRHVITRKYFKYSKFSAREKCDACRSIY
jgi:hypothetical protein